MKIAWKYALLLAGIVVILLLFGSVLKIDYQGLLRDYGALGILAISFLSSTIFVAFPSEPVIILATKFISPIPLLLAASVGATIGVAVNYYIGLKGVRQVFSIALERDKKGELKAEKWFQKYGAAIIFFAPFIPFVGDPLTIVAGALEMSFRKFLLCSFAGRMVKTVILISLSQTFLSLI